MIDDSNHPPTEDTRPTDIPGVFHKNEKLLVALLESASQAIISIDRAGRIVLANRRAAEMFGYTAQELLGARIEILLPESKRAHTGGSATSTSSGRGLAPWGSDSISPAGARTARNFPWKSA